MEFDKDNRSKKSKLMNVFKSIIIISVPTLTIILLFCEIIFRFIFPACQKPISYFDTDYMIARYSTLGPREGLYTACPWAYKQGKWRINNFGWNSAIDYNTDKSEKKLVAVIGDSYIEAFQVDPSDSIVAKLREKIKNKYKVYGFGFSGAPLSQYLQMSRYVKKVFEPEIIIINVVHNDFDESLYPGRKGSGYLYLKNNSGHIGEAKIEPFIGLYERNGFLNKFKIVTLLHMASARYLLSNYNFYENIRNLKEYLKLTKAKEESFNANTNINVAAVSLVQDDIYLATEYAVKTIMMENHGSKVIFMIDGPRRDIYANNLSHRNILVLNKLLSDICDKYHIDCIDLTSYFLIDWNRYHKRFNEDYDYHWNNYGHEVAANALYSEMRKRKIITND